MRVPNSIRNTNEFQKARVLKHQFADSKNKFKDKFSQTIKETFRKKRILSKSQKDELIRLINQDNEESTIPKLNKTPLVSVIVVNRNGASHLTRLLNSFVEVTDYPNYEIIMVDNDSTDNSIEIIESHDELPLTLIKNEKNETFSYANNQAVDISKGEYLLFLNNDIKPLKGWLTHLVNTMQTNEGVGAVGAKLIYPECGSSKINREKSYMLQHTGIIFKETDGYIKPFNRDNAVEYADVDNKSQEEEIIAVTAATMLVKKSTYQEVGGFDNSYVYGYEDVDLCLKLYKAGYKNIYNPNAMLYHYEFGTQEKDNKKEVRDRRLNNQRIFINKWNKWLRKELFEDKLNNRQIFTNTPFTVSFVVTQADENTTAGDYFTALTLAEQLKKFGWNIKYQAQRKSKGQRDWYHVDEDVDVLISLLDRYDLTKVECSNGLLIKVAWLRNWFERWTDHPYFKKYDIVLASSNIACEYIKNKVGMDAILYPLATDPEMFNNQVQSKEEYECDYCFTGSYWDAKREIIDCLNPAMMQYKFNLYGANWEKIQKLSGYMIGFVNYKDMPKVYSSTKIVLDDANHVTKEFGSVNSRVFDSTASGKLIFTNGTKGNNELFDGKIPEYHSEKELNELLEYYLNNQEKRSKKIKELQDIVLNNHTYEIRANSLRDIIIDYLKSKKIVIKVPVPNWNEIHKWGDYYVAEGLKEEFEKKGYVVKIQVLNEWGDRSDSLADTVLVLRGLSKYKPKVQHFNIMWNISHSDLITLQEYEEYDHVYIASKYWTEFIKSKVNCPVECMLQCTNINKFYPEYNSQYESELLFVGNSRKVYRKILKDLLPTKYELSVYGADWEGLINKRYIKGKHIPNNELRQAYSSCKILLNDHWDDMREKGFISNRIFDGIACGACIISDDVEGLDELFPGYVYTYKTKSELNKLVNEKICEDKKKNHLIIKGHTYKDRVEKFLEIID
ncbi:MAG: glycosyltransferase [Methanosphaera sp.]|nr:glycosyltransferase [Methanosphaera sp.]